MSDKLPYPNASVRINAINVLFSREIRMMTCAELGALVLEMFDDLQHGRFKKVLKLPFVDGVRKGASGRQRPAIPTSIRNRIRAMPCVVCGASEPIEVDHIKPLSRGGHHRESNFQPLCKPCNRSKGAKTMGEWLT